MAGVAILARTAMTMLVPVLMIVFPFTPCYILPVAGIMVGNAMTVTGVHMKRPQSWSPRAPRAGRRVSRVFLDFGGVDNYRFGVEKAALLDETILEDMIHSSNEKEPLKDDMPVDMAFVGTLFQKSVSSECLNSLDWIQGDPMKPRFLDFPVMELGAAFGMRRAFSEGDIKTTVGNCSTEERREKLSRYRNKKAKRNFGRKIRYACRKALADSQPRIRGRFARTEEIEARGDPDLQTLWEFPQTSLFRS